MQTWGDSPDWASAYNADGSAKEGFTPGTVPTQRIYGINLRLVDDGTLSQISKDFYFDPASNGGLFPGGACTLP